MIENSRPQRFLILHGWKNRRPPEHWHHWLAQQLTERGHQVDYPQLPDPDEPKLDAWIAEHSSRVRTGAAAAAAEGGTLTVICHSLSTLTWLQAVARDAVPTQVERVLLVAPPSSDLLRTIPEIAEFVDPAPTPQQLAAASRSTRIVGGTEDPFCPEGPWQAHGERLGLRTEVIEGGGHLNPDSGYGPWPAVLEWCLDPEAEPFGPQAVSGQA